MILYRYIVRKHALPFCYAFAVIIFIMMMNFAVMLLSKIIDKGLEPRVVLELFLIQMGWIVALAVPMAILVATLWAFGEMSADNEITAVKASGRGLASLLAPVLAGAAVMAVCLTYFNNLILPEANHHAANLTSDISRKRPAAFIEPGVLIRDFQGYVLYVDRVNPHSGLLRRVKVFSDLPGQNPSVTLADSGRVVVTAGGTYLQLTLWSGESHSVNRSAPGEHFAAHFERQVFFIRNVDTQLQRTDRTYRSDREKSTELMLADLREFRSVKSARELEFNVGLDTLAARIGRLTAALDSAGPDSAAGADFDSVRSFAQWTTHFPAGRQPARGALQAAGGSATRLGQQILMQRKRIAQYLVEVHKKYSIPATCIVFVLIGAPLGIMARRGGLTVGASYSILFFVLFWVFLIGGESLADRLLVPPGVAMWGGNLIIGVAGVLLIMRMVRETTFISFAPLLRLADRARRRLPVPAALRSAGAGWSAGVDGLLYGLRATVGILPVYLIRTFVANLVGVMIALVAVFIVIDYVGNLRQFEGTPWRQVVRYYWYYLPWISLMVLPIIVLLATMFAMGSLAKNSELTAMKGAGISILQLTWPLLALGVVLAAASFYAGEMVLPTANYHRRELKENLADERAVERTGAARAHRELRRDFYYLADKRTMYHFEEFRTYPTATRNVWQLQFDGHRVTRRVQAAALDWRDGAWRFVSGSEREFGADTSLVTPFDTLADTLLRATPEEMVVRIKGKEEMSYWELADYIGKVRRQGEKVWMHMADLYFKIAYPFMNCIVLLLGVAITARAGRKGSAVLFGVGLLITFAYWIIAQFALAFAHTGQLSPLAGAWSANLVFAVLGLVLYRRALR